MKTKHLILALAVTLGALLPSPLLAEEGGIGHYMPGAVSTIIDLPPTKPGWVIEPIYMHYSGDASAGRSFKQAGVVTAGLDVTTNAITLGGLYTFETKVLGAHYTLGAYLPYVWAEVTGDVAAAIGSRARTDTVNGLGDLNIIPAMLAWKRGSWQFDAWLNIYAPTGDYEAGRLANTTLNYWTFDPVIGVGYSNEKTGFNFAMHGGITVNTENQETDYRSGSVFHLEGSITQLLPLGKGYLGIGANAFFYQQVTGDSGAGATLGGFEGRVAGIGPTLSYILPIGKNTLATELKWLPELETQNRLKGNSIWLKVAFQF